MAVAGGTGRRKEQRRKMREATFKSGLREEEKIGEEKRREEGE